MSWRWAVVAVLLAALLGAPTLAGRLPSDAAADTPAAQLLERVRGSDRVAWSGYGEVRGDLDLPDLRELRTLPATIGETSRMRAWWLGPRSCRVDQLTLTGEVDVVQGRAATGELQRTTWDSERRRATVLVGEETVRLPIGADLLPNALGARLARAEGVVASLIEDRRVAGRPAAGLRLTSPDPSSTTVAHVDLWVEPSTGLPLRVEVVAAGAPRPSITSLLLDLDLTPPPAERTRFDLPRGARLSNDRARDLAALADRESPFALPDTLAGLPRADRVEGLGGGVATYGEGFTALTVVPLPPGTATDVYRRIARAQPSATRSDRVAVVGTPLVQLLLSARSRGYLLAGTVPEPVLQRALAALEADPPPLRPGR